MRTELIPYRRLGGFKKANEKLSNNIFFKLFSGRNQMLFLPLAFLLGRASLVEGLMPFGLSIYAATAGMDVNRVLVAVFVVLGMFTSGAREQVYVTVAGMLLFNALDLPFGKGRSRRDFRHAVIAFVSVLIPEMVAAYLQGFLLYDVLKTLFHGFVVFALMFIYRHAVPVLDMGRKRQSLSNEEMISMAIVLALAVSGLGPLQFFGFSIKNIICILVILLFSYRCGAGVGSATGVTVGLIVSMSSTMTPMVIASYAFCGLLAGVLRNLGKLGSSLGFVMGNAILTLYLNGSTAVLIYLKEIIAAILLFLILPRPFVEFIAAKFQMNTESQGDKRSYSMRIREITVGKLNKFSHAFRELAKTFAEISETRVVTDKQDISALFDRVADKVCKDCSLCLHCWDRNFYNTYQVMFKIIERMENKGRIEEKDIPSYFLERCERIHDFVNAVNNIYEIFKVEMVWKNKISESRGLVSQQLDGMSKVIANLASEIQLDVNFKRELEDRIVMELNSAGIKTQEVIVYENKWEKFEIGIFHKSCGGKRSCTAAIEPLVSEITGRKLVRENGECCESTKDGLCNLRLVEEETYKVTTGVAQVPKYGGTISGDSYTFMNTGNGKYIVALSDGMGSGQKAATQSRAAISLLEQFMESGFDKDTAIKLINSILVLKSSDDSFSTIDLSLIDLYDGEVEFVKIGAVPTYLKRPEVVELVKTASLPAGILCSIQLELVHKKIQSGDLIIMMSDGIYDAFKKEEKDEKALDGLLEEITSTNPQEIADRIMDEAYTLYGRMPEDDMLVLVSKVWK
jgi:stage II sporulation protein E